MIDYTNIKLNLGDVVRVIDRDEGDKGEYYVSQASFNKNTMLFGYTLLPVNGTGYANGWYNLNSDDGTKDLEWAKQFQPTGENLSEKQS